MKRSPPFILIGVIILIILCAEIIRSLNIYAASYGSLNATVKPSVCGNFIAEDGEDCDNSDWSGRTCENLGYINGALSCSIACDFDTAQCTVPLINPGNVSPVEASSLYAAGLLEKPAVDIVTAVTSLSTTDNIMIVVPVDGGSDAIFLPAATDFQAVNGAKFDPTLLSAASVPVASVQGLGPEAVVEGALQWGIPGLSLSFDKPISVTIFVGNSFDGQTLAVFRSISPASGWSSGGIIPPGQCLVVNGNCSFQTTQASYFIAVKGILPTGIPTPTLTPIPGTPAPGPSATPAPVQNTPISSDSLFQQRSYGTESLIPQVLRVFYTDESGKISLGNIFTAVKTWVDSWKETVLAEIYGHKTQASTLEQDKVKCDINSDGGCDLKDLSILLYYVEK